VLVTNSTGVPHPFLPEPVDGLFFPFLQQEVKSRVSTSSARTGFQLHIRAAPELRTDRLHLRPHRRDDAEQLLAMWQDPVVVRHFGGQPVSEEDSWNRLLRYVGHWVVNGHGLWAVEELESGRYIGDVGLFEGRRGLGERFDGAPEAGWVLAPAGHGKGYAREAVAAALNWGQSVHGWARTVCMIDPDNAPSFRTAAALGYHVFETRPYRGKDIVLLERPHSSV
jgi:RimJ/RimL family protein N-acetyltransferase